ncbi:MAG: methyltransferase domain-containing protein [Hyphomonadaceae bacterium]|nr:MAG: type 11 methyltransferase [Caulobacteraceae bacterium]MBT9445699.1 methyltransferase domain-containing protein [Hyphomonadaceae bacterium]TPW08346.1 MAG: type 11 methyltransferase [Alphaproteobacteria bacterium]
MPDNTYQRWRSSALGRITDGLEQALLFDLAGQVRGRSLLDVGCGDGALAVAFAKRDALVTGLDTDPSMLAQARARSIEQSAPIRLVLGRAEQLPFVDAQFDFVMASTLLCLVRDRVRVVSEMARVLKPGGRLLVGELGAWSLWSLARRIRGWAGAQPWREAHFHTPAELRRMMAKAGLRTIAMRGSVYYPPLTWAARLIAPADQWLGRRTTFGAAFLAAAAVKPARERSGEDTRFT